MGGGSPFGEGAFTQATKSDPLGVFNFIFVTNNGHLGGVSPLAFDGTVLGFHLGVLPSLPFS